MSIAANTDWEIRTTGASTNGGGFKDLNPGTSVDYSQQASAQLALTDIASDGAGTGISSTTGGFTAAMEGNCMYISGSGFTTGWYQITGYTDTNNITIDRSCGASQSGGTGNVGGAWTINSTNLATFFNSTNKGSYNRSYVKAGTYSSWGTAANTIAVAYHRLLGYNTTRGDCPIGTNRPLFDLGNAAGYIYLSSSHNWMDNIRVDHTYSSGSATSVYCGGYASVIRNCKVTRSGYTGAVALRISEDYARVLQCELVATNGKALQFSNSIGASAHYCYIHDSTDGITYQGASDSGQMISNCIIDTCSGLGMQLYYGATVRECTIYNCGTGLHFTSLYSSVFNSIITGNTTGINGGEHVHDDNNCLYNNTTDRTGGVVAGPNSITSDPLLADPANQDFTLDPTSPCFNTGVKLGAEVGLP